MASLSILGLVANIVQLVDVATRAYKVCHDIYHLGASIEDSQMSYTSDQLRESHSTLLNSLQSNSIPSANAPRNGIDLSDLASQCCKTAEALHTILESLRKTPGGGTSESISKFMKKKIKAKEIEGLKTRLDEYQKVLDSKILIDIRQSLGISEMLQKGQYMKVETQLSQISQDLKTCHLPISTQLKVAIDELIKFNEEQHVITRSQAKTSITDAMQGLKNSQDQHYGKQEQENRRQQQRERFLDSLTFEEINRRSNEVSPSYPKTFEWVFDEDGTYRRDSFAKWLKGTEKVYWINGKAGSGKSTLMKFVANDMRTEMLLKQWSPAKEVLIVTFYLWLSGTMMQRSLKGLLCSVARQIARSDEDLPNRLINIDDKLLLKRSVDDWSCEGLRQLLRTLLRRMSRPVCIFVDGLDEFDQGDNIEELLDLTQELSMTINVKVCVSSRPEIYLEKRLSQYRQVRLQDLTAQDIEICIREKLEDVRKKCSLASFNQEYFNQVVEVIKEKSDGVFLWVHYAINTTLRGMRNGDDFGVLLARVESLPGEMHELYLQMLKRLNGDEQFYREEASTYFSYDSHYPLSLFELMVALDESLQADYMNNVGPLDPDDLARGCEVLKTRILTRCAGLLEVVDEEDYFSDQKPLDRGSEDMQDNVHLWRYHDTEIKFLHRTARDFLLTTTNGQDLLGKPKKSIESRFLNVIKAKLATSIQGLREFDSGFMTSLIDTIAPFSPENEVELLLTIRRIYEKVSMPEKIQHVGNNAFWSQSWADNFETLAALHGCAKYICHFLENERPKQVQLIAAVFFYSQQKAYTYKQVMPSL